MTLSVHVGVPSDAEWTAEVTTVERMAGGQVKAVWSDTVNPGEGRSFYAHDGASLLVAEGKVGVARDGHAGVVGLFAFALGETVGLVGSDERGTIIGRSEFAESSRQYFVRYRAGDGRLTEAWWGEAAIAAVGTPDAPGRFGVAVEQPAPAA